MFRKKELAAKCPVCGYELVIKTPPECANCFHLAICSEKPDGCRIFRAKRAGFIKPDAFTRPEQTQEGDVE